MLKLSITQGPYVGDSNQGFTISVDHCQELSNFLHDWYRDLPEQIAKHVEVIIVGPRRVTNRERISIKVVLSGKYEHCHQSGGQDRLSWKNQVDEHLFHYSSTRTKILEKEEGLKDRLNMKILRALELEIETYQDLLDSLGSMTALMKTAQN